MQKGSKMDPLKPEKGEKYIGPESGTVYEWDGDKWVIIRQEQSSKQEEVS